MGSRKKPLGVWSRDRWKAYQEHVDKLCDILFEEAEARGINNAELARMAGLSYQTVHRMDWRQSCPQDATVWKLVVALGFVSELRKGKSVPQLRVKRA